MLIASNDPNNIVELSIFPNPLVYMLINFFIFKSKRSGHVVWEKIVSDLLVLMNKFNIEKYIAYAEKSDKASMSNTLGIISLRLQISDK